MPADVTGTVAEEAGARRARPVGPGSAAEASESSPACVRLTTITASNFPTVPAPDKEGKRPPLTHPPAVPFIPTSWRKMAWSSLLPEHLSSFETWIARLFVGPDSPLRLHSACR